ncbi:MULTISPECIES: DUF981 family protein [unclassified Microbacterium]|uniref:DUF981 family protein n=1 Tax=unclassified Microbacterium TaxID=2609290 RepID=UPI001604B621|nr:MULTISPECIES: DUF981 family protein [unclassified Microbacterium]QNA91328.1 DUF981 family protein [Microbacterium sp. Se63.02b]QYM64487.1 DUF981 domain-containing protein [Microbacterium sp. Se5.02b]
MLLQGITFNTTMALVAGAIILLIPLFMRAVQRADHASMVGWGYTFIAAGFFLGVTGFFMMLTWPLAQVDGAFCCKVDNFTFGEPAALYGLLTFIAGLIVLRTKAHADKNGVDVGPDAMFAALRPLLFVGAIGGFGLVLIGIGGMHFGMWRPPDIEPLARLMAGSLLEPLLMMVLYIGTGVTAVLAPFLLESRWVARIFAVFAWCLGLLWILLSFSVFYSHIGFFPQPDGSYL